MGETLQAAGVLSQIERATKKRQGIKVLSKGLCFFLTSMREREIEREMNLAFCW